MTHKICITFSIRFWTKKVNKFSLLLNYVLVSVEPVLGNFVDHFAISKWRLQVSFHARCYNFIEPGKSDMANQSSFDRGHKSDHPVNSVVMHRKAFGESPLYIALRLRFVVSILVSIFTLLYSLFSRQKPRHQTCWYDDFICRKEFCAEAKFLEPLFRGLWSVPKGVTVIWT